MEKWGAVGDRDKSGNYNSGKIIGLGGRKIGNVGGFCTVVNGSDIHSFIHSHEFGATAINTFAIQTLQWSVGSQAKSWLSNLLAKIRTTLYQDENE